MLDGVPSTLVKSVTCTRRAEMGIIHGSGSEVLNKNERGKGPK